MYVNPYTCLNPLRIMHVQVMERWDSSNLQPAQHKNSNHGHTLGGQMKQMDCATKGNTTCRVWWWKALIC